MSRELREELLGALLNVLQGEVRDGLQAELRDEIERERRVSAQDSLNERLRWESERDGVRERLDTLASRIDSAVVRATQAVDNMTQRMDPRLCMLEGDRDDTSKRWKQQQKAHSLLQDDFIKMELKLREVEEYHHDNIAKLLTRTLPDALETHNQGHATRAAALEQRINELDSSIQEAVHHDGLREQLRAAVRDHNKLQQLVHQLERNSSDAGLEMHQMKTAGETRKDHWDRALEELHKKIAVLKEEHVQKAAEVHFDMEQREHVTTEQAVALDQLRSRVQTLDSLLQHHKELGTQDVDELRTKLDRLNAAHEKLLGRVDGVQAYLPELAQEQNRCTNQVVDGIRQNTDAALDALRTQIEQLREAVAVGDVERAKLKSDVEGSRAGQSSQASPAGSPKRDADVALLTSRLDDVVARLQIVERVAALASPKDLPGAAPSPSLPNRLAAQEQRCDAMASQLDAFLQSLGAARSALQGMATRVEGIEARLDGAGARGAGPPLAAPGGGRPTQQALQALNDALNTGGVRGVRGALLGGGQVSPRREMPMPAPTALPPQLLPPAPSPAPPLGGARPPPPPGGRPPAPYTVRQPGKWGAETPSIWQESRGAYPGPSLGPTPTGPSPRQSASVVGGSPYKR